MHKKELQNQIARLNNKLNLIAVGIGTVWTIYPTKISPFIYAHRVLAIVSLILGIAPLQEFFLWEDVKGDWKANKPLTIIWGLKFLLLWTIVVVCMCKILSNPR